MIESDVRLRVPDHELRSELARRWSRCISAPQTAAAARSLDVEVDRHGPPHWLSMELTQQAVTEVLGRRLVLHSAGLSDAEGRVIALVGPSEAGKSTAAATLARSEFGYVTDEAVVVCHPDTVVAFPRPLRLGDRGDSEEVELGPDELHLRVCPPALRLSRIVVLDRAGGHGGSPKLTRLGLIDGILTLTEQTASLADLEFPLGWLGELIEACGGVFRLTYTNVADMAGVLRRLLEEDPAFEEPWLHVPVRGGNHDHAAENLIHRAPYTDALVAGDEGLVLVARMPVRLMGLGLTIWRAVQEPLTFEGLLDQVIGEHGEHPEAAQAVETALCHLLQVRVVHLGGSVTVEDFLARSSSPAPALRSRGAAAELHL